MDGDYLKAIGALQQKRASLELKTTDLCFLVAIHARATREGLTCLEEEVVLDTFEQAIEMVEPGADNPRKRATHAIQRFREQRLLARVDAAGVLRAGEYTMTKLAQGIVDFYLRDETLTRESLVLLTKMLLTSLAAIKVKAQSATDHDTWRKEVVAPLGVTVGDLVGGIERRQRGMDAQQEEIKEKVTALLKLKWFEAIEECQQLLDSTRATLQELNEVLLRDATQILTLVQEIEQHAATVFDSSPPPPDPAPSGVDGDPLGTESDATDSAGFAAAQDAKASQGAREARDAARDVGDQVERVKAWGAARQRAWSEYYQHIQQFLRNTVRLDPRRELSERLQAQIGSWSRVPFAWTVASAGVIRLLRDPQDRRIRPPVVRPRQPETDDPLISQPGAHAANINDLVGASLRNGRSSLAAVVRDVLLEVPSDRHYLTTGLVTEEVARCAKAPLQRDRDWTSVTDQLQIEDWTLARGNGS